MTFKTFNVPSFFAGIATVLAILVVGFGGGVMMSGVLSDGAHKPNKIERQAAELRDVKPNTPAATPVAPAAPVVVATEPSPAQTQPAQGAPAPEASAAPATPPAPDPQPAARVQPAPQPAPIQAQAQSQVQPSAPQPQTTAPALGPQKPVSLTQTSSDRQFDPSQLSRRDQARYWREQRRQERALRREERRKQFAERRQQEQSRRDEMRPAVERVRPRELDDDDDAPRVVPARPLFDGLFGAPRGDDD